VVLTVLPVFGSDVDFFGRAGSSLRD
jgi:hypothetical protein